MNQIKPTLSQAEIDYNFEKLKEAVIIEYEETWTRNSNYEDKIAKFLTTLSIVFIAYIYLIISESTWDTLKNTPMLLKSLIIFLLVLYLLVVTNSILHCLNAFKLNDFKRITNFDDYIKVVEKDPPSTLNWHLFYNYDNARIHNDGVLVKKSKHIASALKALKLSTLILSITIFILFISYIENNMTDQPKIPDTTQRPLNTTGVITKSDNHPKPTPVTTETIKK